MIYEEKEYILRKCDMTEIDDECIAYCEAINKLMVLNETAKIVWDFLEKMDKNRITCTCDLIFQEIKNKFEISNDESEEVMNDIKYIISEFIDEGFLEKTEDDSK